MPEEATSRDAKRERTSRRIVAAAVEAFAEGGFDGTSIRDIARRARVTQGLITYYFGSKDELWRRAVDQVFAGLYAAIPDRVRESEAGDQRQDVADARRVLHAYASYSARHPELFQIMVDAGRHDDERMRWIVERHLRSRFDTFAQLAGIEDAADVAHLYYAVVGASSLISAVAPECRLLTGVDPLDEGSIGRHADLVADLLLA